MVSEVYIASVLGGGVASVVVSSPFAVRQRVGQEPAASRTMVQEDILGMFERQRTQPYSCIRWRGEPLLKSSPT